MRRVPVDAKRQDWPRLVSQSSDDVINEIKGLKALVAAQALEITDLKTAKLDHASRIGTLETTVANHETRITALEP